MIRMIWTDLRRVWCQALHDSDDLRPSIVGHGSLRCRRCDTTYADLSDAGALCLLPEERQLSAGWQLWRIREDSMRRAAPTFEAAMFRVHSRGQTMKVGRLPKEMAS